MFNHLKKKTKKHNVWFQTKREDCYSEDEGVETASSHCESPGPQFDPDARRLERLLEGSVSWSEDDMAQLRDQVTIKWLLSIDMFVER